MTFPGRLLAWFRRHRRDLPWRAEPRDPYRVWISEVMLQQTRVETVLPYYERFLREFPTPAALARRHRKPRARLLERARLLLARAQFAPRRAARSRARVSRAITMGSAPCRAWDRIRRRPSRSIAFGLACPALDGNVMRVIARVSGDASDVRSPATRRRFEEIARGWLRGRHPGAVNEALMELGATVCVPREPRCPACPVAAFCRAHMEGTARELPVKGGAREPLRIEAVLAVVTRGGNVLRAAARRRRAPPGRFLGIARAGGPPRAFAWSAPWATSAIPSRTTITPLRSSPHESPRLRKACAGSTREELTASPLTTASRKALALQLDAFVRFYTQAFHLPNPPSTHASSTLVRGLFMESKTTLLWAKRAVIAATVPVMLWAFSSGPDPGHSGVPGESTCVACHTGTALNGGPGSVNATFSGGTDLLARRETTRHDYHFR